VIKVVKPGEMFGEVILFESSIYPVTATALKTSTVYILPKRQFACLLNNESFRNDFIAALMGKMRYLTSQIQYLTSHDVEDRLFLFLEEQHGRFTTANVGISKKDLAHSIGTTPETLSRLLQRLREEDSLLWEGNTVKVDPSLWKRRTEEP
jgi:CRP/FNR family transcriptional regulator